MSPLQFLASCAAVPGQRVTECNDTGGSDALAGFYGLIAVLIIAAFCAALTWHALWRRRVAQRAERAFHEEHSPPP